MMDASWMEYCEFLRELSDFDATHPPGEGCHQQEGIDTLRFIRNSLFHYKITVSFISVLFQFFP